jgi:hypothetical protein
VALTHSQNIAVWDEVDSCTVADHDFRIGKKETVVERVDTTQNNHMMVKKIK